MIWTGPADFSNAISQLLNDLTWRDTKGTLLLFIRNLDVTAAIAKAVKEIQEHTSHVTTRPANDPGDRHDFVLHANGDPDKKLHLTNAVQRPDQWGDGVFAPFGLGSVDVAVLRERFAEWPRA